MRSCGKRLHCAGVTGVRNMAVISLPYRYLERLTRTDRKTILDKIALIGSDIERVEEDHVDVEFFPDRPDLFSPEGVARAMRGFLNIETGLPVYPVTPSGLAFTVDPGLADIRPVLCAAVIRGLSFDDESIQSIMSLQESLHWAVGRGRSKVAIGIHDLSKVTGPFRYIAAPRDFRFVPLDYTESMTMEEMLEKHPKGKAYAHLVNNFKKFPLILDANDQVLSFPPIINGELTRVTTGTTDILLDTTGTDRRAVMRAVSIVCSALAEAGGTLESVTIDGQVCPDLSASTRTISVAECNKLLGLSLTPEEMAALLPPDAVWGNSRRQRHPPRRRALFPGRHHAQLGYLRGCRDCLRVREHPGQPAGHVHGRKTAPGAGPCRARPRRVLWAWLP